MTTVYFVLAGAGIIGLVVWLYARSQRKLGAAKARAEAQAAALEHARKSHEIDEDVAQLSDADLDRELFTPKRD